MQSYLDSGTTGDPIQHLRLYPFAQHVRDRTRLAGLVVVADGVPQPSATSRSSLSAAHGRGSGRFGIWMRAIAFTSFQKSHPERPITATETRTACRFSAVASSSAKMMITSPSS